MGNHPPPPPPPPPPPQIVIIRPEPPPQLNPFDQMLLRKLIEQLVLEAINKYFARLRGGTNMLTTESDEEIPPQAKGDATRLALSHSFAMKKRGPDVEIPQELRDRLMDRDELMGYLEMDIPPEAMPAIAAALRG